MNLVRIGNKIINLDMVVQIDIHDDGVTIYYAVAGDNKGQPLHLRIFKPESVGFLARLERHFEQPGKRPF